MTFRTTRRADQDIIDLHVQGATQFGVDQAERYHEGLMAPLALLADNPTMARLQGEFRPPVRFHPYRSHMVVYVEDEAEILVIRVLRGRQNWESHLA